MQDVEIPIAPESITLSKHTALSIGVVMIVVVASVWIATTMENLKTRMATLEAHGSQPMQDIIKTFFDLRNEINRLSDRVATLSTQMEKHIQQEVKKP